MLYIVPCINKCGVGIGALNKYKIGIITYLIFLTNYMINRYRIKTKKEFSKQYGDKYTTNMYPNWTGDMKDYFGYVIPKKYIEEAHRVFNSKSIHETFQINGKFSGSWLIGKHMLIINNFNPYLKLILKYLK